MQVPLNRRGWLTSMAALLWQARAAARSGTVRILTGFAPGGASDAVARVFAQAMQQRLSRSVVVESRTGADGVVAALAVASARPDGRTLLLGSSTALVAVPALRVPAPYDPFAAFRPVCGLGRFTMQLLVHGSLPVHDVDGLREWMDRHPGALLAASSNSTAELAVVQLAQGRRFVGVPYRGDALALPDLVAGRVHVMVATGATADAYVADGRLRRLASTAPGGGLELEVTPWLGLFAPAGTVPAIVAELAAAVARAAERGALDALAGRHAFQVAVSSPDAFERDFADQYRTFAAAARRSGLRLER